MRQALLSIAMLIAVLDPAQAAEKNVATAILPLDYTDTSGEATDQTAAHAQRLRAFREALGRDLVVSGQARIVPLDCGEAPCASTTPPEQIRRAAERAGVQRVIFGGVHKMSTLVQWARLQMVDVAEDRLTFDRNLSFRNDTDESWSRAERFAASEILLASAQRRKIAIFDFELQDASGGAGLIAESADDAEQLRRATQAARKIIGESGRYELVAAAPHEGDLRDCNGCDAGLARESGAELSLVGIVTRITRTDYAVTYRLRDAKSGNLLSVGQTDLRIGASYSWDRGAAWLMKRKFLAEADQPRP